MIMLLINHTLNLIYDTLASYRGYYEILTLKIKLLLVRFGKREGLPIDSIFFFCPLKI